LIAASGVNPSLTPVHFIPHPPTNRWRRTATGASSLENLGYMTRLGLWGRDNGTLFENQAQFMQQSGFKRSTGALELIAMGVCVSLGSWLVGLNVDWNGRPISITPDQVVNGSTDRPTDLPRHTCHNPLPQQGSRRRASTWRARSRSPTAPSPSSACRSGRSSTCSTTNAWRSGACALASRSGLAGNGGGGHVGCCCSH
jgi:hypothetical protein